MQTKKSNRKSTGILFFTMVVVMLGFGIVIPIMPFYIESLGAGGAEMGFLMAIFAIMQFLFSPIWGDLSDRYGRKPFLIIGTVGNGVALLLFGLSNQMWMLFASRALAGALSAASIPTAMAYISDTTSFEERGKGMGIIGAAFGVGMVIGPGLGGTMAGISLAAPFYLAAIVSVLAAFIIYFALPESLPKEKRAVQDGKKIQGPQLKVLWQAIFSPIGILLIMAFLLSFGLTNFEGVFGLYALNRFDYGPQQVGLILTVIGLISAIVQGMLTGPLTKRFGDVTVIQTSLIGSAIGFGVMLLAFNYVTVLLTVGLFILSTALLRPSVTSLTSKRAIGRQGVAMGLNNSFMSLGRIIGPIWAGLAFDINLSFPYMTGAVIMLLGFIVSIIWLKKDELIQPEAILAASED
ncbi:MAG: MFS transporter [Anaerolineaceae bacterium]|nr:MFS transporter [Anaerolineaceae bacterium]